MTTFHVLADNIYAEAMELSLSLHDRPDLFIPWVVAMSATHSPAQLEELIRDTKEKRDGTNVQPSPTGETPRR